MEDLAGGTPDPNKERKSVRRFDPLTLGYFTIQQSKGRQGVNSICNFRMCDGQSIEDLYTEYSGSLMKVFRLHEILSVFGFCEIARDLMANSQLSEALKDKKYVAITIENDLAITQRLEGYREKV